METDQLTNEIEQKAQNRYTHAEIYFMTTKSLEISGKRRKDTVNGARTGDYPYVGKINSDLCHRSNTQKSIPDSLKTNAEGKWGEKIPGRQYRGIFL